MTTEASRLTYRQLRSRRHANCVICGQSKRYGLDFRVASTGGVFTINTSGTKAVVGFFEGGHYGLGEAVIEPKTRFGAIYLTTREPDGTVAQSRELLVVALARARNTGMKFSPDGSMMLAAGKPPILMEPVKARLLLRRTGNPKLTVLDQDGRPTDRTVPLVNGAFVIDTGRDQSPYYLLSY